MGGNYAKTGFRLAENLEKSRRGHTRWRKLPEYPQFFPQVWKTPGSGAAPTHLRSVGAERLPHGQDGINDRRMIACNACWHAIQALTPDRTDH